MPAAPGCEARPHEWRPAGAPGGAIRELSRRGDWKQLDSVFAGLQYAVIVTSEGLRHYRAHCGWRGDLTLLS